MMADFDKEIDAARRGIMMYHDKASGKDAAARKKLAAAKNRDPGNMGIAAQEAVLDAKEAAFESRIGYDGTEEMAMGVGESPKYAAAKKRARRAIDAGLESAAIAKELARRMEARDR